MNNKFSERKHALSEAMNGMSEYGKSVKQAKEIVNIALGDNPDVGHISVAEMKNNEDDRLAVTISIDRKLRLSILYAEDESIGIDLDPTNSESEPVELTDSDADVFDELADELVTKYRNKQQNRQESNDGSDSESDGTVRKCMHIIDTFINTIGNVSGPKYEDISAVWKDDCTFMRAKDETLLAIIKNDDGTYSVTDNIRKGPSSAVKLSGIQNEIVTEFVKLVKDRMPNDEKVLNTPMAKLLEALPRELVQDLANKLFNK